MVAVVLMLLSAAGLIGLTSSTMEERRHAVRGTPPRGGPGTFVLTQTKLIRIGDQTDFSAPVEKITTRYFDSEHYSVEAAASDNGIGDGDNSRIVRNGQRMLTESVGPDGRVTRQSIVEYHAELPGIFEPAVPANELARMLSNRYPVVDLAKANAMIAAGFVMDRGTELLLDQTVRVFEVASHHVPGDARGIVLGYRLWVAVPSGLKIRVEYTKRGSITVRFEPAALASPASVSLAEFSTSIDASALDLSDYSEVFDQERGAYPPLAQHVMAPAAQTFGGGAYVLSDPVFFTRTERVQDTSIRRSGWLVTQEITGASGEYAVVVQSAGADIPPSGFEAYWPPLWRVSDGTQLTDSIYESRTPRRLVGGEIADSYTLIDRDTVQSSRRQPEFKYLITWETVAGIRVVVVGNAAFVGEETVVALVNALAGVRSR